MLSRKNSLKRKKDFQRVFKEGKGFKEDSIILKVAKNNTKEMRFGFIVSEKVSKKATLRNKVKRRLRELVKARLDRMRKGIDVVLIALPGLAGKDFKQMEKSANRIFFKAKILDNESIFRSF